jgi:hypothetical protein
MKLGSKPQYDDLATIKLCETAALRSTNLHATGRFALHRHLPLTNVTASTTAPTRRTSGVHINENASANSTAPAACM